MEKNIICPYCKKQLKNITGNTLTSGVGIYECSCDRYPMTHHVLFLQKDDTLINKRAVGCIEDGNYQKALQICLPTSARTHACIIQLVLFFQDVFHFVIPYRALLCLFRITGPARSWFAYLLHRSDFADYKTAVNILEKKSKTDVTIIDVGCGTARLIIDLNNTNITYYGIDKSFLSLLIASLYVKHKNILLICANIESGLPMKKQIADAITFLDSFSWVYNKKYAIQESARVLKKKGCLLLSNLHTETPITTSWGYHATTHQFNRLTNPLFADIKFTNHEIDNEGNIQFVNKRHINQEGYSCLAIKK